MALLHLDLTQKGVLSPDKLRRLDRHAIDAIAAYDTFIADLGNGHEHNIDWWVSRPASRNNFVSELFTACARISLIQELLAEGNAVQVVVDSKALATVLASLKNPSLTVDLRTRLKDKIAPALRAWRDAAGTIFFILSSVSAAWLTRGNARPLAQGPITAVDVFVLRDSFANGAFTDRYYPGLLEALSPQERRNFCYIPVLYRIRNYYAVFRAMRLADIAFLIPQDLLRLQDYLFALGHWVRLRRLRPRGAFRGIDMTPLAQADLSAGHFAASTVVALLYYRFWLRVQEKHLPITRLIDWYEGQGLDHAVAAAINWNNANIDLVGFRPVCSRLELSVTPSRHEIAAGVVPRTIAVTGRGFRRAIAAELPELKTEIAPGLRYRMLAAVGRQNQGKPTILVVLPLAAASVTGLATMIAPSAQAREQRWLIKRHPAMPRAEVESLFQMLGHFEFVEGNFHDWLALADMVAGLESSALLEAVAAGIPALCLARGNVPTRSPFPEWVDHRLWRICYDAHELQIAICELIARGATGMDIEQLRHDLLSPADRTSIRRLLALPP